MDKKVKGYLSLEAVYIMFFIVMLYSFLISVSFFMYDRCLLNQDCYLLAFRACTYTDMAEDYGEIIYGETRGFSAEEYVESRWNRMGNKYPLYQNAARSMQISQGEVIILHNGVVHMPFLSALTNAWGKIAIKKQASVENPISYIKGKRR